MPGVKRVYGKRKTVASNNADLIFGRATRSAITESPNIDDITTAIQNFDIKDKIPCSEDDFVETSQSESSESIDSDSSEDDLDEGCTSEELSEGDSSSYSTLSASLVTEPCLLPLVSAYSIDRCSDLVVQGWSDILEASSEVTKIAEASYAEVYRVTTSQGSSILKVMQLRIPSDPSSLECYTAIEAAQVVSEFRIMNALTEVPGFVTFKDAHLIQGSPSLPVVEAHDQYLEDKDSEFPHPSSFSDGSMFLVMELGDAGQVLEDIELESIDQVWDILLGVIMALSRSEDLYEFEHRDLHENNICYAVRKPSSPIRRRKSPYKFGRSGTEITIIDYGLSRAKLRDEIIFLDLDIDLEIFHGPANSSQHDSYRRMRSFLLTGQRIMHPKAWHVPASSRMTGNICDSWSASTPYSNVLWIKYILGWLKKTYKKAFGNDAMLTQFNQDVKELERRLNPRTLVKNGGFESCVEILQYIAEEGWLSQEHLEGGDCSTLLE